LDQKHPDFRRHRHLGTDPGRLRDGRTELSIAPPQIADATYVGSKKCADCHEDQTTHFGSSTHAKLALKDAKGNDASCEACHGAGSVHVKAGGSKGTIVNPSKIARDLLPMPSATARGIQSPECPPGDVRTSFLRRFVTMFTPVTPSRDRRRHGIAE